jgi:signal peptidase
VRHYLGLGLSGGILALVAALATVAVIIPFLTGSVPLTVLTGSMEPSLPPGTLVIVRNTPIADVRIGDVMTYQIESGEPEVVTHRVIGIVASSDGSRTFSTQGDNNPQADPNPVVEEQVKGTVWYSIPLLGYLAVGLSGGNKSWLVSALAVLLLGYASFLVVSGFVDMRRKRTERSTAP